MWLLTSEPKSAWLVLSHDPGAPPVVRFHQAFGSWACSSQHPPPSSNLYPIDSGPLHIISQSASLLFLFSKHLLYQRGQPLAYIPSHPPPPQKRQGKSTTTPSNQPPGNFISPTFASCGKSSLQFDLPHHQSGFLASFLSCPIPPKIVSFFYPALCSFNA